VSSSVVADGPAEQSEIVYGAVAAGVNLNQTLLDRRLWQEGSGGSSVIVASVTSCTALR